MALYQRACKKLQCGRPLAAIQAETGADHAAAGSDISVALPQAGRQDDIACVLRVVSEAPLDPLTYNVGQGGKGGLFAIGIQDDLQPSTALRDKGGRMRTPEQLWDDLVVAGRDSAVMMDGAGPGRCNCKRQYPQQLRDDP